MDWSLEILILNLFLLSAGLKPILISFNTENLNQKSNLRSFRLGILKLIPFSWRQIFGWVHHVMFHWLIAASLLELAFNVGEKSIASPFSRWTPQHPRAYKPQTYFAQDRKNLDDPNIDLCLIQKRAV